MTLTLQRVFLSLGVITWGAILLWFFTSGRLLKYLAPDFRILALMGGLGLCVLGLFNLLTARRSAPCGHDHGPDDTHDHESLDLPAPAAFLILVLPLALTTAWTKDGFSIAALTRKGLDDTPADAGNLFPTLPPITREVIEQQHPADENGYRKFPLLELFFIGGDPEMRSLVEGMPITTQGRLLSQPDAPPNHFRLYRLFITCCAADSRPIPVAVHFKEDAIPEIEANTWVTLSGTINYPDLGRGPEPVLEPDFVQVTDAPPEESFMRGY